MTDLANYTQIATLVKSWADRLEGDAGDLSEKIPPLVDEMRAFSNGLVATVNVFRKALRDDVTALWAPDVNIATGNGDVRCPNDGEMVNVRCWKCGMIRLTRVVQTCEVCPSQWNAWDAEGNYYYLRYRSGRGSVWAAKSEDEMEQTGRYTVVREWQYGDSLDGYMTIEEFAQRSNLALPPKLPPMVPEEV